MIKKNWPLAMVLILAISMVLSACGGGAADDEGADNGEDGEAKQVLNLLEKQEIPSMDTSQADDTVSFTVMNNVFEGLYRLGKDNQPVPGIAESHEVNENGNVYTFHLRDDAKWSNGDPVTAADFVYAWHKALHPDTLSDYAYIMAPIKNASAITNPDSELYGKVEELGVEAVDDYTLTVTLEAPAPYFLGLTAFATFMPQNEAFVESQGDQYALEVENLIYNGPFVLSDWKHEQGWTYEKNENYWDKAAVKLEQINVKVVKDTAARVNLYQSGETDRAILNAEFVDQFKGTDEFHTYNESVIFFLRMNEQVELFTNKKVRQAIDMAYNKENIANVILNNGSKPAYYIVPGDFTYGPNGDDYRQTNGNHGEYNVEKAQQLWAEGLAELGKESAEIEFLNYDTDNAKRIGEYVKNQLETNLPGLTVSIKQQPFKQKLELEASQDYELSLAGWGPDYQDPMTFLDLWVTGGSQNQMDYSNEQFDELIQKAKLEADPAKRWDYMLEAEQIMFEDQAISPVYQRGRAYIEKPYVKDLVQHNFGPDYSYKWTSIEK